MPTENGLYYRESGAAKDSSRVLVWLHGAGGASEQWPHQLRRIAGWRVLAPDLPGHGRSGGNAENDIGGYARQIVSWLDKLELSRVVLGGHSMGAAIALATALKNPETVAALILLGAGARMPVNPDLLRQLSIPDHLGGTVNQIAHWSFGPQATTEQRERLAKALRANATGVLAKDFQACANFDVRDQVKTLGQSTLVIAGTEDQMMPAYLGQSLAESLSRGIFVDVKGAGHMMMQDYPRKTQTFVKDFLDGLPPGMSG